MWLLHVSLHVTLWTGIMLNVVSDGSYGCSIVFTRDISLALVVCMLHANVSGCNIVLHIFIWSEASRHNIASGV